MANAPDEPTKLELLEAVAKVFSDSILMSNLRYGGVYVLIERQPVRVDLVNGYPQTSYQHAHKVYVGSSQTGMQEIYVAYGSSVRVAMTYRQATELARILPELKWENI